LNDCENVAKIAEEHGVKVALKKSERMIHAFPILSPLFPEAKQAMSEVCEFAKNSLTT
jgi:acetyl esterase/lipase